jgi:hypothetical protein
MRINGRENLAMLCRDYQAIVRTGYHLKEWQFTPYWEIST